MDAGGLLVPSVHRGEGSGVLYRGMDELLCTLAFALAKALQFCFGHLEVDQKFHEFFVCEFFFFDHLVLFHLDSVHRGSGCS